jgi:CHAT domain-containing protein
LRARLAEIEAAAGSPSRETGTHAWDKVRQILEADSTLFSFHLGNARSWVWVVTSDGISLHALPPRAELATKIKSVETSAQNNSFDFGAQGAELYDILFGAITGPAMDNERWLLALDGELFDVPFPALRAASGQPLIRTHDLQITPGALMLRERTKEPGFRGTLLGVGDPIYNAADNRAPNAKRTTWTPFLRRAGFDASSPSFARLWGTGLEIQVAAREWQGKSSVLLTGASASKSRFWTALESKPAIIHIATHILEQEDRLRTGWIALSLGRDGQPEYLTPEEISARSIVASLVVLSGCSSGKAEVRTASGLMGLTRAWMAAGAGSVLATRWPTVDDDGIFFESFYRNLRQNSHGGPASALRKASIEMVESGTWRAQPSFWSGYFLVGSY